MIDDGYRKTARLLEQLRADLDAIRDAEPGGESHRKAVDRYAMTFRALSRSPYPRHAAVALPRDDARP